MNGKRIIIIGCGGSGKSTLARQLGSQLRIPVVHLDQLYWRRDWNPVSEAEFDALLQSELEKECWIIDGNYNRTMENRLRYCDTVIYLNYSRWVCLSSAFLRVFRNWGKTRPDMGEGCPEKIDFEFIKWIWTFNRTYRKQYLELLNRYPDKETYIFHRRGESKALLKG